MARRTQDHEVLEAEEGLRAQRTARAVADDHGPLAVRVRVMVCSAVVVGLVCIMSIASAGCGASQPAEEGDRDVAAPEWSPAVPSIAEIEDEFSTSLEGGHLSSPLRLVGLTRQVDDEDDLRRALAAASPEALVAIDGPAGFRAELLYSPGESLSNGILTEGRAEYDMYSAALSELERLGASENQTVVGCSTYSVALGWSDRGAVGIALESPSSGYSRTLPEFGVPMDGDALLDVLNAQ